MNILFEAIVAILQVLGLAIFKFYGWVVIVGVLAYMSWQNRRKSIWVDQTEHVLLRIEVPKENEKKELSAEQMFASLHGILRPQSELTKEGSVQEHISFEIASVDNQIQFYVWTPKHLKDFVEGQIYAQYPNVHISEGVDDYSRIELGDRVLFGTELILTKPEVLPIKTFQSFEVDPLAGITAVLSKLEEDGGEMWIQVLARPIDDTWQEKGEKYIKTVKGGPSPTFFKTLIRELLELPVYVLTNSVTSLAAPGEKKKEEKKDDKKEEKLTTGQSTVVKAVEEKITKLGYEVRIRIAYLGPEQILAKQRLQAIVGGFKQFNTTNLNGFTTSKYFDGPDFLDEYKARLFLDGGYILNIEELASLYHLPHKSVETPNLVWTTTKTAEPPPNLPTDTNTDQADLSLFAQTNFRGGRAKFGIKRADRGRHLYVIGQTGTGKSNLLKLLTLSDIYHNQGLAIIDPHGDFATDMMQFIPEHRLEDVIYFNPTDRDYPIAFNPMEVTDSTLKNHISSELVGVLKRLFEATSWGPRLEYILRYTILALLDYPDSTLLGITRMLTEKDFRKKVIKAIQDPVVKNFWVNEFASWNDKFANEAVAPVLNKVGAFTANPLVRNIIGQPKSAIDLRKIMDDGKILIVNLSRGQVGEDNAAILGALMVTKIQLAAMGRASIPMDMRRPFYLYVDEFQNFATDSFAVILSEARKYGLNLTVANQYVSQMPETVRDAVFGNVGSMITFRIGANDATIIGKYFEPVFEPADLIKLHNYHAFISMSIGGDKSIPFSGKTLAMPPVESDFSERIIDLSRQRYANHREDVEKAITRWSLSALTDTESPSGPTEVSSSESPQTITVPSEQKPNTFLGALKNPEHTPHHSNDQGKGREASREAAPQNKPVQEPREAQREYVNVGQKADSPTPEKSQSIDPNQEIRLR
jgi:hypothetical protein